jgi:flagellar biosynthesis component FlhA
MTAPTISDYATESLGWKTIGGGIVAQIGASLAGIDWATVITLAVVVLGGVLHLLSYRIKKREEKERHAAAQVEERRAKERHELEIALLKKKLEDTP